MAQFVLHVPDIDSSGKQYRFAIPATWVKSVLEGSDLRADVKRADGSLDIRADRSGEDVVVTGKLTSHVVADCVRCLEDAVIDVDVDLAWLFTPRGTQRRSEPEVEEVSPDEMDQELYSGDDIVLDDMVREHIILEVPMQPLCSQSCPGIEIPEHVRPPADFGKEEGAEDVDPRLAPLKKLAGKLTQKE